MQMNTVNIEFTIPSDSDGYVPFGCPFCCEEFKLLVSEIQSDEQPIDNLFCPYCGLNDDKSAFFAMETEEHIQALVENYAIEQINKMFGKMAKEMNRSEYVKAKFSPERKS